MTGRKESRSSTKKILVAVMEWLLALTVVAYGSYHFLLEAHLHEAQMHERIGAEQQRQRNYLATMRYRAEISELRTENRKLKLLGVENTRLRMKLSQLQAANQSIAADR